MNSFEIFTRNSAAHHILENLSQHFLSNILNFHGNMSLQLLGLEEWQKSYPPQEKIQWVVWALWASPTKTSLSLKNSHKNSMVCSDIGHELLYPGESKCIAHLCSVMRMKIMLNDEDTVRFRQHCENVTRNFFWTRDTKIVIKSQHRHEIRSGLRHSIPKTCKMTSERANLHQPTVLARCARIYPRLFVSWYRLYIECSVLSHTFPVNTSLFKSGSPCRLLLY